MLLNRYVFVLLLLGLVNSVFATGPSYMTAEIRPISINNKGEVLCRTRFVQNPMGAHWYMPVTYGFCILSGNKIIQYDVLKLELLSDDEGLFEKEQNYQDSIFYNSCLDATDLCKKLKSKYRFASCNVESYKVDKYYQISEFEKLKDMSLSNKQQKSLYKATSTDKFDQKKIHVLYDFGDIVILENKYNYDESEEGIRFSYQNILGGNDIGFDYSQITGVLYCK